MSFTTTLPDVQKRYSYLAHVVAGDGVHKDIFPGLLVRCKLVLQVALQSLFHLLGVLLDGSQTPLNSRGDICYEPSREGCKETKYIRRND